MKSLTHILGTLVLILTVGRSQQENSRCDNPVTNCDPATDYFPNKISIKYASQTLLGLNYQNTFVDLTVRNRSGATWDFRLVRCGCTAPSGGRLVINIPPKNLFVEENPTLSLMAFGVPVLHKVRAIVGPVFNPEINAQVGDQIVQLANNVNPTHPGDFTALASLNISLALLGATKYSGLQQFQSLNLGIPYFIVAESEEALPLGRAEYVKLFGLMLDEVQPAEKRFQEIESDYLATKRSAGNIRKRPSVVLNVPIAGKWSQPGGLQYTTQFLRDANADYRFMLDCKAQAYEDLTVADILRYFRSARYWINAATSRPADNYTFERFFKENKDAADAMRELAAVKCGNTWVNMKQVSEDRKVNDFFESASVRPDLVLRDLVKILHSSAGDQGSLTYSYSLGKVDGLICPFYELPSEAPQGMSIVKTKISLTGASRFVVEDELLNNLDERLATAAGIRKDAQEIMFESPPSNDSSTIVTIRSLVPTRQTDDVKSRAEDMRRALRSGLRVDGLTAAVLSSEEERPSSEALSSDNGSSLGELPHGCSVAGHDSPVGPGVVTAIVLTASGLLTLSTAAVWYLPLLRKKYILRSNQMGKQDKQVNELTDTEAADTWKREYIHV